MSVNYVIASYEGINKRKHLYPRPEEVLGEHIDKLLTLKNNLDQITIMKAECKSRKIIEYYKNIDKFLHHDKIKSFECQNYGFSMGQWLKCYEMDKKYDYYLFIEDDYCPNMDNFDIIFKDIYKKKFPNNIGLLCSLVQGSENCKKGGYPIHFEGCVFVSRETMEKLYSEKKWETQPRKYLDLMSNRIDPSYNWDKQKKGYIGGYYQLSFSNLFTLCGIKHDSYLEEDYQCKKLMFPYWSDRSCKLGGCIFFYNKNDTYKKNNTKEDIKNSLIVPVQLSKENYINNNFI